MRERGSIRGMGGLKTEKRVVVMGVIRFVTSEDAARPKYQGKLERRHCGGFLCCFVIIVSLILCMLLNFYRNKFTQA